MSARMNANNPTNGNPIFSKGPSNSEYLKQSFAFLESTINKNVAKQTGNVKKQQEKNDCKSKDKQLQLRMKIKEAEDRRSELIRMKQVQQEKLYRLEKDEEDQVQKIQSDIAKCRKEREVLEKSNEAEFEYIQFYGNFIHNYMKLDWKKNVGKVLCPEGKTVVSMNKADKQECNYWDCPGLKHDSA